MAIYLNKKTNSLALGSYSSKFSFQDGGFMI